jgi:hypothetical protein
MADLDFTCRNVFEQTGHFITEIIAERRAKFNYLVGRERAARRLNLYAASAYFAIA